MCPFGGRQAGMFVIWSDLWGTLRGLSYGRYFSSGFTNAAFPLAEQGLGPLPLPSTQLTGSPPGRLVLCACRRSLGVVACAPHCIAMPMRIFSDHKTVVPWQSSCSLSPGIFLCINLGTRLIKWEQQVCKKETRCVATRDSGRGPKSRLWPFRLSAKAYLIECFSAQQQKRTEIQG